MLAHKRNDHQYLVPSQNWALKYQEETSNKKIINVPDLLQKTEFMKKEIKFQFTP
jgi:hypothetical protein